MAEPRDPRYRSLLASMLGALLLAALPAGAATLVAANAAPKTWEFRDGRWPEVTSAPAATQPKPDPVLIRAEELVRLDRNKDAMKRLVPWLKQNPTSPLRDRGLFLMAEALYQYGNRVKAFYYLDELMDEFPDSRLYSTALQKQYDIADAFLNGYKSRLFYIPMLNREDEGVEMMYRIQSRSPGSPLAEKALHRTADYYYDDGQYDLAADVYGSYIRSYPRNPDIDRIKLRQAFSNWAQFRGLRFDPTPLVDARAQLMAFAAQYPQIAARENIDELVRRMDITFARKLLVTADYYRRTDSPRASIYTYRVLIDNYPNSDEAEEAKSALAKFPAALLEASPPGRNSPFGQPTTRPLYSEAR